MESADRSSELETESSDDTAEVSVKRVKSYGKRHRAPKLLQGKKHIKTGSCDDSQVLHRKRKLVEAVKQICGICLSSEGKTTVRGTLNCCSHFFCFACIMEWAKVESRCPLCKLRFATITRTADGEEAFRNAAINIPKRDQAYQLSEEELRAVLDPYENALCGECHQGGDDALMLLCDLCDSPAHTYCVGLGREVPEGNWYCDCCKLTAVASSTAQTPASTPTPGANANFSASSSHGVSSALYGLHVTDPVSRTPAQYLPSSPFGSGAVTLFNRRRIQGQIHQLLNRRSREEVDSSCDAADAAPLSSSRTTVTASQQDSNKGKLKSDARKSEKETLPTLVSSSGNALHHQASASANHSAVGALNHGASSRIGQGFCLQQEPTQFREPGLYYIEKKQVQKMVRTHLKSLSGHLGYNTFKSIARTSTHTVLAALALEHRSNEVYPIQTQPINCGNFAGKRKVRVPGCLHCFDLFVKSVVEEILYGYTPLFP